MQAVILDDLEVRHQAFREKYGHIYRIEHCYNIAQFIHFVLSFPATIDFISLDHDLGDDTMDSHPTGRVLYGTGMDAAKLLIALLEPYRPVAINVHSHNYPRQEAMVHLLRNHGYPQTTDFHFTDD